MTKKILVTCLVFSLLLVGVASAQEVIVLPEAGITPDSPLYIFDGLLEKLSLMFTFNQEKKAAKEMLYAEEKLVEVKAMLQKQKMQGLEVGLRNYEKLMSQVQEKLQAQTANKGVGAEVRNNIMIRTQNHLRVLSDVYDKVPAQAKAGVENALMNAAKSYQQSALQLNQDAGMIQQQLMQNLSASAGQQLQQGLAEQLQVMQQEQNRIRIQQEEQNMDLESQLQQQQQTQTQQQQQTQVQIQVQEQIQDQTGAAGDQSGSGSMGEDSTGSGGQR